MATLTTLPRITRFLGTSDGGPSDGRGSATCPHCGASGRYVHSFECEDGSRRAAMSGCIKLFPVHPIAEVDMALQARARKLRDQYGPTAKLNSWDERIKSAVDAYYTGQMDERTALAIIRAETIAKANYRRARYRR